MHIAVTGASGFVGQALCPELRARGHAVRAVVRSQGAAVSDPAGAFESIAVRKIDVKTDWSELLAGVDCVIHCAARAHVMHETETDALAAYRAVNVEGTRYLAEQAADAGVRRFLFLSSIGVNGVFTTGARRFDHEAPPNPVEDYAISKWEAEQALWEVSAWTGMEVVVVRPPLVYGPQVKGNFLRLLQLISSGFPLPFGLVHNHRSLVGLDNLIDLLIRCINHPAAAGQTFLVSDDHDLSTSHLIRVVAHVLGKSPRLLAVPVPLLRLTGRITGKVTEVERLISSLQVDISHTREVLGWIPPVSVEEGLRKTAEWYLSQ